MFINYKNNIIYVKRNENESDEHYLERLHFASKFMPKTKKEYKKSISYSNIYMNIKYLGCHYDENIHNIIVEIDKQ